MQPKLQIDPQWVSEFATQCQDCGTRKFCKLQIFTLCASQQWPPLLALHSAKIRLSEEKPTLNTIRQKNPAFYDVYWRRSQVDSLRKIARSVQISESTARRWVQEKRDLGVQAHRRTRNRSTKLGRPSKVTKSDCETLLDPTLNPVRTERFEVQIDFHNIQVQKRQLQRKLKEHTNQAQRYKQGYIQKQLSSKNLHVRVTYGWKWVGKTMYDIWYWVVFTDEAHFDPGSEASGYILREQGTRYNTENLKQHKPKQGNKLHYAAYINWFRKGDLVFYNDEEEHTIKPPYPRKPRKTKYQSNSEYQDVLSLWEAGKPHDLEVKPKGNAMTQDYFTNVILPGYIDAINQLRS